MSTVHGNVEKTKAGTRGRVFKDKGRKAVEKKAQVLKTLAIESTILLLGYRALQRGEALNLHDQARVELAINVIENCSEVAR